MQIKFVGRNDQLRWNVKHRMFMSTQWSHVFWLIISVEFHSRIFIFLLGAICCDIGKCLIWTLLPSSFGIHYTEFKFSKSCLQPNFCVCWGNIQSHILFHFTFLIPCTTFQLIYILWMTTYSYGRLLNKFSV